MAYLIKNGTIVDGTEKPSFEGDVLIEDDKIKEIGDIREREGFKIINAEGLIVCPGFIDVNNHSDTYWTLFDYPNQESLITQGITTIIGGNCGSSLAPLLGDEAIKSIQKYVDISKAQVQWSSFKEYLDFLKGWVPGVNFASLVGHATLRRSQTGDEVRSLRKEELVRMVNLLDRAMQEGALGLSSGLVYSHLVTATEEEIMKLAEVVKKHQGVYAVHLRWEDENLLKSLSGALNIAQKTGVKLQISHLKVCGKKNWFLQEEALEMINKGRENGLEINFDVYPYTHTGPVLYTLLPQWVVQGGKEAFLKRLKEPKSKEQVITEMKKADFDYGAVIIAISKLGGSLSSRKVAEIAKSQERSPEEVIIDLIIASDDQVITIVELLSDKNVEQAIGHEASMVCTNGTGYAEGYRRKGNIVHPRCFGAFPRFIDKYVKKNKTLTLEEAIHKITGMPAEKFGLADQTGRLEKKLGADIVIFDLDRIKEKADLINPFQYSEGIKYLFIGGKPVIWNSNLTNLRNGRIMTKKK